MSNQPAWTMADAQAARAHAWASQGAAPLGLDEVAAHMNRNRDAFDHYTPQQGDVVVSAYFKAGTNWIMHLCHQICHLGQAEFAHIQDVIPWPDAAEPRFWINVHDDTPRAAPTGQRVIKSHLPAGRIPLDTPAKYIAVTRDPKDCAASAYHFFRGLVFGDAMPSPEVWLAHFRSDRPNFGRWDTFTAAWCAARVRPNVLFLCFEDIKRDARAAIRQIADFMAVDLTPSQFSAVAEITSFGAMKRINYKFYPARQTAQTDPKGRIIRKGQVGGAATLFANDALQAFDQHWTAGLSALGSDFPYQDRYGTGRVQP